MTDIVEKHELEQRVDALRQQLAEEHEAHLISEEQWIARHEAALEAAHYEAVKVVALKRELAEANKLIQAIADTCEYAERKTLEAQAREKVLYNALTTCVCAMQDYQAGIGVSELFDIGERNGRHALMQPTDDTALKAALAAERELCIKIIEDNVRMVDAIEAIDAIKALGD